MIQYYFRVHTVTDTSWFLFSTTLTPTTPWLFSLVPDRHTHTTHKKTHTYYVCVGIPTTLNRPTPHVMYDHRSSFSFVQDLLCSIFGILRLISYSLTDSKVFRLIKQTKNSMTKDLLSHT